MVNKQTFLAKVNNFYLQDCSGFSQCLVPELRDQGLISLHLCVFLYKNTRTRLHGTHPECNSTAWSCLRVWWVQLQSADCEVKVHSLESQVFSQSQKFPCLSFAPHVVHMVE